MASFIVSDNEDESTSEVESNHSDYRASGGASDSSTTSSVQNSSELLSADYASPYDEGHSRRLDSDSRGRSIPLISRILPPFGRVGFSSKISSKIAVEIFQDELNYHSSLSSKQKHPFSFFATYLVVVPY